MDRRDRALAFVHRFAAGDIDGMAALLADAVRVSGPLLLAESRSAYLEALRRDPPEPRSIDIVSVMDGEDGVAVFYQLGEPSRQLAVAQRFRFDGSRICAMQVIFDTRAMDGTLSFS